MELRLYDPDLTSALTQPLIKDQPFFSQTGEPVVPLRIPFCTVEVDIYIWTLSENIDLSRVSLDDDDDLREEVFKVSQYPRHVDFSKIDLGKINKALLRACEQLSGNKVFANEPRSHEGQWIHQDFFANGRSYYAHLEMQFRYSVLNFHDDKNLVIQRITDVLKQLQEWKGFKVFITCALSDNIEAEL